MDHPNIQAPTYLTMKIETHLISGLMSPTFPKNE